MKAKKEEDSATATLSNRRLDRRRALSTMGKVAIGVGVIVIGGIAYYAGTSLAPVKTVPTTVTTGTTTTVPTTTTATTTVPTTVTTATTTTTTVPTTKTTVTTTTVPTTTTIPTTVVTTKTVPTTTTVTYPGEKVTLRVATVGGTRFEIPHKNVMDWWKEKYPNIEIAFTTTDWGGTVERTMAELSAGTGAYDVVFIDWIVIQALIEAGWLRPLEDLIHSSDPEVGLSNYPDDFDATKLYMGMKDGKTYAMPFDFNCQMTYYREDVFKEVGITVPDGIDTWDACLETAKKLHDYNPDYKVGFTMKPPWWTVTWFTEHLFSKGGIVYDEKFVPQMTSPEAKDAMNFALEFYKYAPPEVLNWEDAEIAEAMKAGVVVFAPCTWGGAAVTSPEFNPFAEVTKLARIPKGTGGMNWQIEVAGYGGEMGGAGYAIPVVCKRPDLSWKFIRFVVDLKPYPDEKTQKYLEGGAQPTKRDVLGDPGWQKQFPLLKGLSDNGPYAQFKWMQVPEFPEIAEAMAKEIGDVFTGAKSIDDGLKGINDATYKIFQRSGRYG